VAGVYSTRFIIASGGVGWVYYVVPPYKRAVLKQATFYNTNQAASTSIVAVQGYYFWAASTPGAGGYSHWEASHVAYQGEQIGVYAGQTGVHKALSGYLLDDDSPPPGAPLLDFDEGLELVEGHLGGGAA
jgi:hypothetical protein